MSSLRKEFQATEPVIVKNKNSLADFVIQGGWLVQSLETLTDRLSNLCQSYIEYSDLQADVQKTTGLTKAEVEALGESLSKIDTRSSQAELMELATTAGKLGITSAGLTKRLKGYSRCDLGFLERVAEILDVPVVSLIDDPKFIPVSSFLADGKRFEVYQLKV